MVVLVSGLFVCFRARTRHDILCILLVQLLLCDSKESSVRKKTALTVIWQSRLNVAKIYRMSAKEPIQEVNNNNLTGQLLFVTKLASEFFFCFFLLLVETGRNVLRKTSQHGRWNFFFSNPFFVQLEPMERVWQSKGKILKGYLQALACLV